MLDVDDLGFAVEELCICFDLVQCSASPERLDGNNLFLDLFSPSTLRSKHRILRFVQQASKVDCSECISWSSGLSHSLEVKSHRRRHQFDTRHLLR